MQRDTTRRDTAQGFIRDLTPMSIPRPDLLFTAVSTVPAATMDTAATAAMLVVGAGAPPSPGPSPRVSRGRIRR